MLIGDPIEDEIVLHEAEIRLVILNGVGLPTRYNYNRRRNFRIIMRSREAPS